MMDFTGGHGDGANTSAADAIETARHEWQRMYRDATDAGREVPVMTIPKELAPDSFRASADATDELSRLAGRRTFGVSIDLAALEARRRAHLSTQAPRAQAQHKPGGKRRRQRRG